MTTTDATTQLRALADHIETHGLNDTVLSVNDISTLTSRNTRLLVVGTNGAIRNLVRWADSLNNVAVSTMVVDRGVHIKLTGTIDSGQQLEVTAVALGDDAAFIAAHLPVPAYVPVKPAQIDVAALRRLADARVAKAVA